MDITKNINLVIHPFSSLEKMNIIEQLLTIFAKNILGNDACSSSFWEDTEQTEKTTTVQTRSVVVKRQAPKKLYTYNRIQIF